MLSRGEDVMAKRTLKFSFRKNAIYDRRGSRALSDLWWRGVEGSGCDESSLEFTHYCRRRVSPTLEDIVYLYHDLYMPRH